MPSNLFSKGNAKLHSSCAVFSLPNKLTCMKGLKCWAYCYSSNKQNPTVTDLARNRWWEAFKQSNFVELATAELKRMTVLKSVRLMAHGDAYSIEFIEKLYTIAKALPHIAFYEYTKRLDLFTSDVIARKPSNFKLIFSYDGVDPDYSDKQKYFDMGFDSVAVVYDKLAVQPSCVTGNKKNGYCMDVCKKCIKVNQDPIFLKVHGARKNKR